jgi:hypothetical protein
MGEAFSSDGEGRVQGFDGETWGKETIGEIQE